MNPCTSIMPHYKLTYFQERGRADPIRLMLTDAGVEFEDVRLSEEEFEKMRETGAFPLRQVPILEVDGRVMMESRAIMRHIARKYGYNGTTEEETTQIDIICEMMEDLVTPIYNMVFRPDDSFTAKLKEEYPKVKLPCHLKILDKILEGNPQGKGYFVGKDATMADFVYHTFIETVVIRYPEALADYPRLRAAREVLKTRETLSKYLAAQPYCHV